MLPGDSGVGGGGLGRVVDGEGGGEGGGNGLHPENALSERPCAVIKLCGPAVDAPGDGDTLTDQYSVNAFVHNSTMVVMRYTLCQQAT